MTSPAAPASRGSLALATAAAAVVAALVLTVAVLPAEYGIDPTGVGAVLGFTRSSGADEAPASGAPFVTTPPRTLRAYESAFPTTATQLFAAEGYLAEGDTTLVPFTIAEANLTRVTLRLDFVDANTTPHGRGTRPDTFEIELKAPDGDVSGGTLLRSDPTTGGGHGSATYRVREAPFPRELETGSEEEARAAFADNDPPDLRLAGEWRARVTMVEAQDGDVEGAPLPGVGGTAASDDGNGWRLTVTIETYRLEVHERPGSERRADVATLEIASGGELEYKLRVNLGERVDYAWRTNGPIVYVDFHGERTDDASGAFARHKSGDLAADQGTLVAPFDGTHGWFWRNTSGERVTITLETRGQYDVVGRV